MRIRRAELQEAVRRILFDVWDPIGLSKEGLPPDEYDRYVLPIFALIVNTRPCTTGQFYEFLNMSQRGMGVTPIDSTRIHRTAEALSALREEIQRHPLTAE